MVSVCSRLLSIGVLAVIVGCSGIESEKTLKYKDYPPNTGAVDVIWRDHGVPSDPNSYELIGKVTGAVTWCGIEPAETSEELHSHLINEAGKIGGDAVILHCGDLDTVGRCRCVGDVIRYRR